MAPAPNLEANEFSSLPIEFPGAGGPPGVGIPLQLVEQLFWEPFTENVTATN